jgi:AraC-like DNA-binding protein
MTDLVVPAVKLDLSQPPAVHGQGRAIHGVRQLVDDFRLPKLWSLHLYSYHAELEVDGQTFPIAPGLVSLVPPAARIQYRYRGPSMHLFAHLHVTGRRPTAGNLRMMMVPGPDLPAITDLMESAITFAATWPERTRADIWSVLLRLAGSPPAPNPGHNAGQDHVAAAMSYVEFRLPEALSVPQIAAAVGLSPGHLTRVFVAATGETVVGYVRRRRIDHARRLLTSSTMSISAIAASVGIPDLQAFNKTCRAVTGQSPRQLRDRG